MKTVFILSLVLFSIAAAAQDSLYQARIKSLQNKVGTFSEFAKKDSVFLICFWSVSSEDCITELNEINLNLEKWHSMKSFRFMAVCVDVGKTAGKIRPIYNMNSWNFEVYDDLYGDMRRSLHSNNLPQSMIIYKNHIIYEQTGWNSGSENYLFDKIPSVKN